MNVVLNVLAGVPSSISYCIYITSHIHTVVCSWFYIRIRYIFTNPLASGNQHSLYYSC